MSRHDATLSFWTSKRYLWSLILVGAGVLLGHYMATPHGETFRTSPGEPVVMTQRHDGTWVITVNGDVYTAKRVLLDALRRQ